MPGDKDYQVTIVIKNRKFLKVMQAQGIKTIAELSRQTGINQSYIGNIATLKVAAYSVQTGELYSFVETICAYLKCMPEDIFPEAHLHVPIAKNRAVFEANMDEIKAMSSGVGSLLISKAKQEITTVLHSLPEHQRRVITLRFDLDGGGTHTLQEIAKITKRSQERVRQLEGAAMRKLRNPGRLRKLQPIHRDILEHHTNGGS